MPRTCGLERVLRKLLEEDGVVGYSVRGNKIIIYVEDEATAATLRALEIAGYETEVKAVGRIRML